MPPVAKLIDYGKYKYNEKIKAREARRNPDKLIVRTEYPQIPPKVEYALSERGKSLMTVLDQLCVWGEENRLTE